MIALIYHDAHSQIRRQNISTPTEMQNAAAGEADQAGKRADKNAPDDKWIYSASLSNELY